MSASSPHTKLDELIEDAYAHRSARAITALYQYALNLEEQLEALDDALRDILDVTEKWTRPMTDEERLLRIDTIAKAALPKASSPAKRRSCPAPSDDDCTCEKGHWR